MTWGEGGFSGPPKKGDVIYERPLIVSFSTPVDKAKLAKIRDLYLGNGLIIGRQISPGSQTSMAL